MNLEHRDYRSLLKDELEQRCQRNPRYSLRSFARDLSLTSARLSEILNGKTGMSRERAERVGEKLGLAATELSRFCDLVEAEDARSALKKELARKRLQRFIVPERQQLQMDVFKTISDWYHYAILELTAVRGFKSDKTWIAASLGITQMEAKLAVERLLRLEMLAWVNDRLAATESFTASPDGVPSESLRKFHQQLLKKAEAAVFTQSVGERNLSSVILAFDTRRMKEAALRIKEFRRGFNAEFGPSTEQDSVYCLAIQFFSLSALSKESP